MRFHGKLSWLQKPLRIRFDKIDGLISTYNGRRYYLVLNDMIQFITGLHILYKKGVLQILANILQEFELIHAIIFP